MHTDSGNSKELNLQKMLMLLGGESGKDHLELFLNLVAKLKVCYNFALQTS